MTVRGRITRLKRTLSQTHKPNTTWRPELGMFKPAKDLPFIKMGWPVFDHPYDPRQKLAPSSFRQYTPPVVEKPSVLRDLDDYGPDNFHELWGKFQFEAQGRYAKKGEVAEKETFTAAFDLHLVGWLKIRTNQMLGHVQGDVYALSYFRRWLEEKHISPEAGSTEWVRFWDTNTGLELPLRYNTLQCVKDQRKYKRKKIHLLKSLEKAQIAALESESAVRRQEEERFYDANCVRNY